jgi:hypothetical protein
MNKCNHVIFYLFIYPYDFYTYYIKNVLDEDLNDTAYVLHRETRLFYHDRPLFV